MFDDSGVRSATTPREQQLADLRARMAQITGHVGTVPPATTQSADVLAVSVGVGDLLPGGGLARGTVVACHGSTGVLLGLLAGVTAAGHGVAVVGGRRLGLLAVAEMGGDLSLLAIVDPTGGDPFEVVNVLADGVEVVVIDPGTRRVMVPAARARVLLQKIRTQRGVLICTDKVSGLHADLTIRSRVSAYLGLGAGFGRVQKMMLDIEVTDRSARTRRAELLLAGDDSGDHTTWTRVSPAESEVPRRWGRAV